MTHSAVQICNRALSRIGVEGLIQSLDERSREAEVCALFFDEVRDVVLAAAPWRFATRWARLAEIEDGEGRNLLAREGADGQPVTGGEGASTAGSYSWLYAYALPADCLVLRYLLQEGARPVEPFPFEVAAEERGLVCYTNLPQAEAVYTARIDSVALWSPGFVSAFGWRLAVEVGNSLGVPESRIAMAQRNYQLAISEAWTIEAGQERLPDAYVPESIRARW